MKPFGFLEIPSAAVEVVSNPVEIKSLYKHWRKRVLYSLFIGYAVFYFVRKNLSVVTPLIIQDLGFTKTQMGAIWSVHYLFYGIGKFGNGILGDRSNPRYLMAFGLALSALLNIFFGLSSSLIALTVIWAANGWVQSMGWPPCARLLTHWFRPKELGTFWGVWNISHQVGAALIMVLAGWAGSHFGWRWAFFLPAALAFIGVIFLLNRLRDDPVSVGLPPIEKYDSIDEVDTSKIVEQEEKPSLKSVLANKALWFLAIGNFFVYIVRYGVMDWAPTYLVESRGNSVGGASLLIANFEIMGIFGALLAGILSDKLFKGRRGPLNVIYMTFLIGALLLFWLNPGKTTWVDVVSLGLMGFLIYGPQMLVGVAAADIVSNKASATATGFTGLGGYLGGIVSGVGAGYIVDKFGWDGGFKFFVGCAAAGALCFVFTWSTKKRTPLLRT